MSWAELRVVLRELAGRDARPLRRFPDPAADHALPVRIALAPWATGVAAALHERFDGDVQLTVGFLAYPAGRLLGPRGEVRSPPPPSTAPVLDPADVEVEIAGPLEVRTGDDLRTEVDVVNHRSSAVVVSTGGALIGRVLDATSGRVVGAYSGAIAAPFVAVTVDPGTRARVRLLVGTASYDGSLGYAVPPGDWQLEVVLSLADGDHRAPPLPLRVLA